MHLGFPKFLPLLLLALLLGPVACAQDEAVTIQGRAEATKDGLYVAGVFISDSLFGIEGHSRFIGKDVVVKGVIGLVEREDPNRDGVISQGRPGGIGREMTRIESIEIKER